jgi:hypothetical protein
MLDIVPIRAKIVKPGEDSSSGPTIDDAFDDILGGLNGAEAKKEQAIREELQRNYDDWSYHIGLLKEQFGEVWELFGRIEDKVQDWFRGEHSYGHGTFMGASGYGYNFGTGIHYFGSGSGKPSFRSFGFDGKKYLIVSFAKHTSDGKNAFADGPNGAGDERDVGRNSRGVSDEDWNNLVGLENCHERTLSHQLSGSKYMLEKLRKHPLKIFLYNHNIGRQNVRVGIESLYDNSLKEACQKLFVII